MKMVKTRLWNRTSDVNLPKLMHIAIEGPDLSIIYFQKILKVFNPLTANDALPNYPSTAEAANAVT